MKRTQGARTDVAPERPSRSSRGSTHPMLRLQRLAGNAATSTLLMPVQRNAKFDEAATKPFDKTAAPDAMAIPEQLKDGLQAAWDGSFPGGTSLEQGGILVLTKEGKYEWRAGKGTSGGSFRPNYGDVKEGEVLIATGHTHPYDKTEGGHTDVAFSGGDLSNLVWQTERVKVVQSGTSQFAVAKTKEFDALVAAAASKEDKLALRKEMNALWDTTFQEAEGTFQERVVSAARTVCDKYHLVYMSGSGGNVAQPKAEVKAHVEAVTPVLPTEDKTVKAASDITSMPATGGPTTTTPEPAKATTAVLDPPEAAVGGAQPKPEAQEPWYKRLYHAIFGR